MGIDAAAKLMGLDPKRVRRQLDLRTRAHDQARPLAVSPKKRAIVVMRWHETGSVERVAMKTGLALSKVRRILREELGREDDDESDDESDAEQ